MPKSPLGEKIANTASAKKLKPEATAKVAGKTNQTSGSLVKCEVQVEKGVWVSPSPCSTFLIDADANFPTIMFEIQTSEIGPFSWSWEIKWNVLACPQNRGKKRFKPKSAKLYAEKGSFISENKSWKANLRDRVIGGELTVKVKAGSTTFIRKTTINGVEPGIDKINAELLTFTAEFQPAASLAKKIFKQESQNRHFFSDDQPLVSFDNGYGLGQATNPPPAYEQVWNWKKHVEYIVKNVITEKRKLAKKYLDQHGKYTEADLETETLVYYNGANFHYLIWDEKKKSWEENTAVVCDPDESNKGWNMALEKNKGKTLEQLKKGKGGNPNYTGRCYAAHIKQSEKSK